MPYPVTRRAAFAVSAGLIAGGDRKTAKRIRPVAAPAVTLSDMAEPDRLRAILDVVQAGLDDPALTGAELAGRAYLSRFHFDRLVVAGLGEPPGAFRRRLLLERSAHRLASTSDP